jgi:prepilin-type N-terminal cleavage/methylation domain-containing protein
MKTLRGQRGYTLIEIIVVLAIIAILTSIAFTSLNIGNNRENTRTAALNFRNEIRSDQEKALTNQQAQISGVNQPADYYGVVLNGSLVGGVFQANTYSTIRVEHCASLNCSAGNYTSSCGSTVVTTVKLPTSVFVTATPTVSSGGQTHYLRFITFQKSSSTPYFWDDTGSQMSSTAVTLSVNGSGSPFNIQIDQGTGRIDAVGY